MRADDYAVLLDAHEYALGLTRGSICSCGYTPIVNARSLWTQQDYHREHLASVLADATT